MIELPITLEPFNTVVQLLEPNDPLPLPEKIDTLYLDFETTSGNTELTSLNPHRDCAILGVAVLFDKEVRPYYIPVRHSYLDEEGKYQLYPNANQPIEKVHEWLKELFKRSSSWCNQNLKYDAHCLYNETGILPQCKMIDTLILAKLSTFPEQFSYSLDNIMKLFGIDITEFEKNIKLFLGKKIKDYGLIPARQMATYAAIDVLSCRYIRDNIQIINDAKRVLQMEQKLIPLLISVEQIGVRVDLQKIYSDYQELTPKQEARIQQIRNITGYAEFVPNKKKCLEELFIKRLEWELDYTPKSYEKYKVSGDPEDLTYSFAYESIFKHKKENPEIVQLWLDYQEDEKLLTSFVLPYLNKHSSKYGVIKCNFNQIVHTGRMSCTSPNMMQLSQRAKEYIIPFTDDYTLVEFDLSQIEFRMIVHYIRNQKCMQSYKENPDTDYHSWTSEMCGIPRDAAKTVNFLMGYGGGKTKLLNALMANESFISSLDGEDAMAKANRVYELYHSTLPELKPTKYQAQRRLLEIGHVKTLFGRPRNLHRQKAHNAFNSACQGAAADLLKDITLRLRKYVSIDCILHLFIHDSWLFSIKKERVDELIPQIKEEIERPIEGIEFSVPLVTKYKVSNKNWREAK